MATEPPRLYVLAGVNGAGKSSVGGAAFRDFGADYFNPDEAARALMIANPGLSQVDANGAAWQQGRRLLEHAIAALCDFAFEKTLGGGTFTRLLGEAAAQGFEVRIWFAGLATAEFHHARVQARVRQGGHDIPESDIRRRFDDSRVNLVHLMPALAELRLYDNSVEADPALGKAPKPRLLLHFERGRILAPRELSKTPAWAKPIVAEAMRLHAQGGPA